MDQVAEAKTPFFRRHGYAVGMLCAVYTASCVDRSVINILAEPIKRDLSLTDGQLGILSGIAFAFLYTALGVPLARYADRPSTNRVQLISVALAIWSVMTVFCGLAANYLHLLLARLGVGFGEAGGGPGSHSLIADLSPVEKRASAMAIFALGIPFGRLIGLAIGGLVAYQLGWRWTFVIAGAPGLLLALAVWLTIPEPRKNQPPAPKAKGENMWAAMAGLMRNRTFFGVTWACMSMTLLVSGQGAFLGSFLIRVHGWNIAQTGVALGLALGGAGAVGTWLGGLAGDRYGAKDARYYMLLPVGLVLLSALVFLGAMFVQDPWICVALLALSGVLGQTWYGPAFATIQRVTPASRRATAAALNGFIVNMIGVGLGPLIVGVLSDWFNHGFTFGPFSSLALGPDDGLRWALCATALMPPLAVLGFLAAARSIRADLKAQEG